jgi:hypothetical protein
MSNDIRTDRKRKKVAPEPIEPPAHPEDVAPLPPGTAHSDYDDEVGSQRRLRWMTQILVIPAFVGGLWCCAALLAYSAGWFRCEGAVGRMQPWAGCAISLAVLVPVLFKSLRGKIGFRRRSINIVVIVVMLALGAYYGWSESSDPEACGTLSSLSVR